MGWRLTRILSNARRMTFRQQSSGQNVKAYEDDRNRDL